MTDIDDRILGSFYGVALGDAMGMPGELWPRARVLAHFGRIDRFLPGPDGHFVVDGYRAGQITDDTQQTIMLAGAIVDADGAVDAEVVSRHLVAWADRVGASEGNFLGPSSARAIQALRDGASPWETGKTGETNGAAMRIAPVGLISSPENLPALVDRVEAASLMSHHTDVAISGASLIAAAVAASVEAEATGDVDDRVDAVLAVALEAAVLGAQRGERVVAASIPARARMAQDLARSAGDDEQFLQQLYDVIGASVSTVDSVPAAVGLFVRAQGDPVRSALLAANLGGDTDTIGAISGGICGAFSGYAAIPADLAATLDEVNDLPFRDLAPALAGFRRR
ncbi:MAG TPA: ADP-ribosylglycohydrolase family protein [Pseudolysinimonas sp.]|nr:ADP-ribosylglycohydrolase family protein [Pseudolysinimonas sp.]